MALVNLFIVACIVLWLLYKLGTRNFGHWKKKNVKELSPFAFVGNWAALKNMDGLESVQIFYNEFKETRFGGIYLFQVPFLSITEPEMLKQVLVKDAEHFINRHDWSNNTDPLMSKSLSSLKGDKWRKMRAVMTTVFTSSKMKDMFNFMEKCAQQSVDYLETRVDEQKGGKSVEVDLKDFFSRYGTDVIATTAFGLEVDSFKNPNNEFYTAGLAVRSAFQGLELVKFWIISSFPLIAKTFNLTFFGSKCNQFLINVIEETIRERVEKNIVRKDVIHILMEARKGKLQNDDEEFVDAKIPDLTDLDIAAQAIVFFFAGFETIATLLSFVSYELAINPDIQEKLQREIDEVVEKENGVTYYGVMHHMQYLNMVVHETLRKWPPATLTDREVSTSYVIPETDKSPRVVLNKGEKIIVPIAGFHYDPEYFPNPKKFDPERFRDEKNTIKPFTFLPFGEGLRHCVGMRYALMEAKTVLVQVLRKFTIVPTEKTEIPIKLKKTAFMLNPEKGFFLGVTPRTKFYV